MASRERISPVDTAWLRMDRPNNLMAIVGVMSFAGKLKREHLKRLLEDRLLRYRRFRQKVTSDASGSWWEDDADFDIDLHLHRTALPGAGGKVELQQLVAELIASPLDRERPLWQFHLVENYRGEDGSATAMILRIHHAIGDGIALIGVIRSLTDATALPEPVAIRRADKEVEESDLWRLFFAPMSAAMQASIHLTGSLWAKSLGLMLDPGQVLDGVKAGAGIATEMARLAAMPNDAPSRLKGIPGVAKRVAWSEPIPLPEIKLVGKLFGCSVNDVLLSAVTGALAAYLAEKGDSLGETGIRALVPVNLRKCEEAGDLGNCFGMVTLDLPVGIANPLARLYAIRSRMEELKHSYQAMAVLTILALVGLLPKFVQSMLLDLLANKASAVMTNVPGPTEPCYLAGARISQEMFWVPQSGNICMGVSILSYDGKVQFGLVTDAGLVPDPERVIACFAPEFEKILYILLLEADSPALSAAEVEDRLAPALARARPRRKARA